MPDIHPKKTRLFRSQITGSVIEYNDAEDIITSQMARKMTSEWTIVGSLHHSISAIKIFSFRNLFSFVTSKDCAIYVKCFVEFEI